MVSRYNNILETIGGTPIVRLNRIAPDHVNLYVKVESFNPMGSVKDRLALGVIQEAERSGALSPGQTVIEATSGNTGIGLAMVCALQGVSAGHNVMAENFSVERRRKLMRFLGARVVLTPASLNGQRAWSPRPQELAETPRLVPGCRASSTTRPTPMHACPHHGTAKFVEDVFADIETRLLGLRLWYRRHAERRIPGTAAEQ